MRVETMMKNLEFLGQAEGDRLTYYIFRGPAGYIVVSPSSRGGFNLNTVDVEAPEVVLRRFSGQRVTGNTLKSGRRPDLFSESFDRLNALYVMVALRKAKKLKKREGKAMVFKISAN